MTLQSANRLTAAESALVDAFASQIGILPGDGGVMSARDILFDDLKRAGLPTRRIEAWHYTDLKALLREIPADVPGAAVAAVAPLVTSAAVSSLLQGRAVIGNLPEGVTATRFGDSLASGAARTALVARDDDDAIGRINGSFVRDGIALAVADGVELVAPIELQAVHGAGQVHGRFPAAFGADSKAVVIERHVGAGDAAGFVTSVATLALGARAEVTWIVLQQQGAADTHLGQLNAELGEGARLRLLVVNAGGRLVRQEIHVKTAGAGADFTLRGVNLLGGDSHTDVTMTLGHDLPETTSTEIIRNVVFDRARGVFQGQIRVAPDAQKTDARMACNTLLLSDEAEFSVKPELEIFADDVQCAHGATVVDIDRRHLYYLMARGIPERRARGLLVNAFVAEIVEALEDEALVEALDGVIADWLQHHG